MGKCLLSNFVASIIKAGLVTAVFLGLSQEITYASPVGYDYRSIASGNWDDVNSWERRLTGATGAFSPITSADIPDASAGSISIRVGDNITLNANTNADQLNINAGGILTISSGVTLDILDGATDLTIGGTLSNAGNVVPASGAVITFIATGKYQHNYSTTFGTIPTATWNLTSTMEFIGYTNPTGTPVGFNQSFGNVVWNTSNATSDINLNGALSNIIKGDFTVVSTNGRSLNLSNNASYALVINGNLNVLNNSILNVSDGALLGNTFTLTLKGNLNLDANALLTGTNSAVIPTLVFNGTSTLSNAGNPNSANLNLTVGNLGILTLNNSVTMSSGRFFRVSGVLSTGTNIINGAGSFVLNTGTIEIGSPNGITAKPTLSGNIQVTGTRTFPTNSTYIYNGTTTQVTGSGLPTDVAGLTINNASGLSLSNPVLVNLELKLTNGILNTSGKALTVGNTALLTLPTPDKISFVEGALSKTVDPAPEVELYFPIGKAGVYRPMSLNLLFNTLPSGPVTYTAEQINGSYPVSQTFPGSITKVSSVRYFKVTQSPAAPIQEGLISLTYGSDDGVTDMSNLSIAQPSGSGSWLDKEGTVNVGSSVTAGNIVTMFDAFSDFILANKTGGANPLPVELVDFSANVKSNTVTLNWATASEKNNDHFEVERSLNGFNFEKIATVKGKGTSNTTNAYSVIDQKPVAGINYYRLKQVDLDGTFSYSEIVNLNNLLSSQKIKLYPNPVVGKLNVQLPSNEKTSVRVTNLLGQEVLSQEIENSSEIQLDTEKLPAGTYQLLISGKNFQLAQKFIKLSF